ncbi:MAG: TonB-dependent receptor, partial [Alphaproteobacteria bacterium]|nr:TonB-dependent receptor [Alphaproteobacteria bacterium]
TKVEIRGMPSYNTFVSLEGMPLNDPGVGGVYNFSDASTRDTQEITVIKGPRALLHDLRAGSGAIIMNNKRGQGPQSFFTTLEGGTNKSGLLFAGSQASKDDTRYYTSFSGQRTGAGSTINKRHGNLVSDYYRNLNGIATLQTKLHSQHQLDLSLQASESTLNVNQGGNQTAGRPYPTKSNNTSSINRHTFALSNKIQTLNNTLHHDVYAGGGETRMVTNYNGTNYVVDGLIQKIQYGARYSPKGPLQFHFDMAHEREIASVLNKGYFSIHMNNAKMHVDYKCTDALNFGIGIRAIKHRLFGKKLSYWGMIDYKLLPKTTLFGAAGVGYRFPLIMDLYQTFPEKIGNPNLMPEKNVSFDMGAEHTILDDRLIGKITYFQAYLSNLIVTRTLSLQNYQKVNDGHQKSQGLEFDLTANPFKNTKLMASYTYIDANESRSGNAPLYLPRHKISLSVEHSFSDNTNVFFQFIHANERLDQDFSVFPANPVTLCAQNIMRLGGSHKLNKTVELYGRIENALNNHAETIYGYGSRDLSLYVGIKTRIS